MTTTSKAKRTAAAVMAALMVATTAANIGASAHYTGTEARTAFSQSVSTEKAAEELVKRELKNKSYEAVLEKWQETMKDPTKAFPKGCDLDGDGEVSEEEENEIGKKVQEYAAGITIGLMKKGLNTCCDGLADCFEAPMKDLTNAVMGVPGEASSDDVMKNIDNSTKQVLAKISDSENKIAVKVNNLNVLGGHGTNIDDYESSANNHREAIKVALKAGSEEEKAVEIANSLGDLGKWASIDIVKERGKARDSFISDFCAKDFNNGNNLYKSAFQATLDKDAKFMKEAVENSQSYVANCTNKYLKSSITLLEMLVAMEQVSKFTPQQIASLSGAALENYNNIKTNAGKATEYKAVVLEDLFGTSGILTESAAYINRKHTEPTTYVGRGLTDHVKLKNYFAYSSDIGFIEPYQTRKFIPGDDWRWIKGSDTKLLDNSGLTYKEVENICKHAVKLGYTVENYLTANGFKIDKWESSDKHILVTGHFDEYQGTAWLEYRSYEGLNGFDISKAYSEKSGAEKFNMIEKVQQGFKIPVCDEFRIASMHNYMYFVKA